MSSQPHRCKRCGNNGPWPCFVKEGAAPVPVCPLCVLHIVIEWDIKKTEVDLIKVS